MLTILETRRSQLAQSRRHIQCKRAGPSGGVGILLHASEQMLRRAPERVRRRRVVVDIPPHREMSARLQRRPHPRESLHPRQPVQRHRSKAEVEGVFLDLRVFEPRHLNHESRIPRRLLAQALRQTRIRLDRQQRTHRRRQNGQGGVPRPRADLETGAVRVQAASRPQPYEKFGRIGGARKIIQRSVLAEFCRAGRVVDRRHQGAKLDRAVSPHRPFLNSTM